MSAQVGATPAFALAPAAPARGASKPATRKSLPSAAQQQQERRRSQRQQAASAAATAAAAAEPQPTGGAIVTLRIVDLAWAPSLKKRAGALVPTALKKAIQQKRGAAASAAEKAVEKEGGAEAAEGAEAAAGAAAAAPALTAQVKTNTVDRTLTVSSCSCLSTSDASSLLITGLCCCLYAYPHQIIRVIRPAHTQVRLCSVSDASFCGPDYQPWGPLPTATQGATQLDPLAHPAVLRAPLGTDSFQSVEIEVASAAKGRRGVARVAVSPALGGCELAGALLEPGTLKQCGEVKARESSELIGTHRSCTPFGIVLHTRWYIRPVMLSFPNTRRSQSSVALPASMQIIVDITPETAAPPPPPSGDTADGETADDSEAEEAAAAAAAAGGGAYAAPPAESAIGEERAAGLVRGEFHPLISPLNPP